MAEKIAGQLPTGIGYCGCCDSFVFLRVVQNSRMLLQVVALTLIASSFALVLEGIPKPGVFPTAVVYGDYVYYYGGAIEHPLEFPQFPNLFPDSYETASNELFAWDPLTGEFTQDTFARSSAPRAGHSAVVWSDKMYVFGGTTDDLNVFEAYDFDQDLWFSLIPSWNQISPSNRFFHAATVAENNLYVYGGYTLDGKVSAELWNFNFVTGQWIQEPSSSLPRAGSSMFYNGFGHLVVFGGTDGTEYHSDLWAFDIISRKWENWTPEHRPSPRAFQSSAEVEAAPQLRAIFIFGGVTSNSNGVLNDVEFLGDVWILAAIHGEVLFESASDFSNSNASPLPRSGAALVFSWGASPDDPNGLVLFAGQHPSPDEKVIADVWVARDGWQQKACFPQYEFPFCTFDCRELDFCNFHGTCTHFGTCACEAGWSGVFCETNLCDGYRGYDTHELNIALLPKSIESMHFKLDAIRTKLSLIRELLPKIDRHNVETEDLAFATNYFYEYCLVNSLCPMAEGFERAIGCEERCGSETQCVSGDYCLHGQCIGGTPKDCSEGYEGNACVLNWCDEELGCQHSTRNCDDGDPCTIDWCDVDHGCVNEPKNCSTHNCCLLEGCFEGECYSRPKCEDFNPCTIDICDNECSWGECNYELEECCYMSLGQTAVLNPQGPPPRPLGVPIILTGTKMIPPNDTPTTARAYFWLRACDNELIYDIQIQYSGSVGIEDGVHFYGPSLSSEVSGVIHTLSLGDSKVGSWKYDVDGVSSEDLLNGLYYVVIHLNTGDIRAQIEFNQ